MRRRGGGGWLAILVGVLLGWPFMGMAEAPALDATGTPTLASISEDIASAANTGTAVQDIVVTGSITDPDGPAVVAIALTAVETANGSWEYSLDDGGTWTAVGTVSDGQALLLDGTLDGTSTQRIRFLPSTNFHGTVSVTFRAWDKSEGVSGTKQDVSINGGATAFSSGSDTASLTVTPVNDLPTLAGQGALKSVDGGSAAGLEDGVGAVFPPVVAVAGNGERFVVVWTEMPTVGSVDVKARVWSHAGEPLTSVISVTPSALAFSTTRPMTLDVAMDASGRFVVAYDTVPDSGGLTDVVVRRYLADGTAELVTTIGATTRHEGTVSVAISAAGRVSVGYNQVASSGTGHRAVNTLYTAFDSSTTTTTSISSTGHNTTATAFLEDESFLYAYATVSAVSPVTSYRRFLSTGIVGAASNHPLTVRVAPRVVAIPGTNAWYSLYYDIGNGTTNLVRRRVVSGSPTTLETPVTLVTGVSPALRPSAVVDANGEQWVCYSGWDAQGAPVAQIRRFDAAGLALGGALVVGGSNPSGAQIGGGTVVGAPYMVASVRQTVASSGANTATGHQIELKFARLGLSLADTSAPDVFENQVGQLIGGDVEGSELTYGLQDAAVGAWTVGGESYDRSVVGDYGTFYVSSSDGRFAFVADADAVNALNANASENYLVTVSDGEGETTSPVLVEVTAANDDPVVPNRSFTHPSGPFKIAISSLLGDASDPEFDDLALDAWDTTTTGGGSVVRSGGWLLYTPGSGNPDTFQYTVGDGAGGSGTATVTLETATGGGSGGGSDGSKNQVGIQPDGPDMVVTFAGIPGVTYLIQYTTSLAGTPVWTDLGSSVAGLDGRIVYRHVTAGSDSLFYRTVVP